uniref:Uncharacterized protein n=1 Tax=Rhizophora mucronata TaxID=61149 RepID=A0A2P2N261_RHIMU
MCLLLCISLDDRCLFTLINFSWWVNKIGRIMLGGWFDVDSV